MKKYLFPIFLLMAMPCWAFSLLGIDLKTAPTHTASDTTMFLRSVGTNPQSSVGTGVCYGPIWTGTTHSDNQWISDIGLVCGLGTMATTSGSDPGTPSAAFVTGVNVMGFRAAVGLDPVRLKPVWSMGFSLVGVVQQFTNPVGTVK